MGGLQYPNRTNGETYPFANVSGYEANTLNASNLPVHVHTIPATSPTGSIKLDGTTVNITTNVSTSVYYDPNALAADLSDIPGNGKCIAQGQDTAGDLVKIYTSNQPNTNLAAQACAGTGTIPATVNIPAGSTDIAGSITPVSIDNRQPYVVLNYIMAVNGMYPTRT